MTTINLDVLNKKLVVVDPASVYLTPYETAFLTGKSLSALKRDRHEGRGMPYVRASYRDVRYQLAAVLKYMTANTIGGSEI